jgi:hypothetical protein
MGDRVGESGGIEDSSGADGDCGRGSPYGGIMPVARSGLSAKGFHGGDMPSLDGDGGSIGTGCSLRRATLTVLRVKYVARGVLDVYRCWNWRCCVRQGSCRLRVERSGMAGAM